jgi:hypothetical protein
MDRIALLLVLAAFAAIALIALGAVSLDTSLAYSFVA